MTVKLEKTDINKLSKKYLVLIQSIAVVKFKADDKIREVRHIGSALECYA